MGLPARRLALAVMVALGGLMALVLVGCSANAAPAVKTTATPQASPSSSAVAASSTAPGLPGVAHIAIIVMENKPASAIVDNPEASFINSLADQYALAADYSAVSHPSLPNYLALTSGSTQGITDDRAPKGNAVDAANIADRIEASGRTWKLYGEGMPAAGAYADAGRYATKHIPFLYYNDVLGNDARRTSHIVPFAQLAADLKSAATTPDYLFITPDLVSDMHDGSIAEGDAWLARHAPAILASPAFTRGPSLLVVTWDEGSDGDNHVVTIFAGSAARTGYVSPRPYDHYSLLRTVEALWGLSPLTSNDAGAQPMSDLFRK